MTDTAQQEVLSPDLIPFISKPDVSMAEVSVEDADLTREMDQGLEVETGRVHFQVISPIHGSLRDGQIIALPAKRVFDPAARARHGFDAWNTLSLRPGERVVLAVRSRDPLPGWIAVAAQDISEQEQSDVAAVRRAYTIEDAPGDVASKAAMLQEALHSGHTLLLFYAINFLRRHASERDIVVNILAKATTSARSSDQKLELGRALTSGEFFQRQAKADPVNCTVVGSLATALIQETDGGRRTTWVQLLGSCVLMSFTSDEAENREIRLKLAHFPGSPAADQVESALAAAESSLPSGAKEKLQELQRIWQHA